jgi:cytochrome c-type biogenesis protein CcmH
MIVWIAFALMTAALLAALVYPLMRGTSATPSPSGFGRAVFRDQLAELDRDVARGVIGVEEAASARNEIARRLIAAVDEPARPPSSPSRWPFLVVVILVPAIALPLYWQLGSPHLEDVALAARLARAVENSDLDALIPQVEAHLAAHPDDLEGWKVLAPVYAGFNRYADAARAYRSILRLSGNPTADLLAGFAEMLVLADGGTVSGEAARAFDAALKLDPAHLAARYYKGLALKQEGRKREALAVWKALLAEAPGDAGWKQSLEEEIASLSDATAPALTEQQMAAAQDMDAEDRDTMIRSMVDGLEARLKGNGDDLDGWRRLIRARTVLGETDAARQAYFTAKQRFQSRADAIASLDSLARELGILR